MELELQLAKLTLGGDNNNQPLQVDIKKLDNENILKENDTKTISKEIQNTTQNSKENNINEQNLKENNVKEKNLKENNVNEKNLKENNNNNVQVEILELDIEGKKYTVERTDNGSYWQYNVTQDESDIRWKYLRLLSVSDLGCLLAKSAWKTREQLADEMTGYTERRFNDKEKAHMNMGKVNEAIARDLYRKMFADHKGLKVTLGGLVVRKDFQVLTGSPDGYVGDDGIIEIKCSERMPSPILQYCVRLEEGEDTRKLGLAHIQKPYWYQMQGYMYITNRKWCDYVHYCKEEERIFIQRVNYDEKHWKEIVGPGIKAFIEEFLKPRVQKRKEENLEIPVKMQKLLELL